MCTCGKWQNRELPCIDAMAYFRNYKQQSFPFILENTISSFYTYNSLQNLHKDNICPVIIPTLGRDLVTLPPNLIKRKRSTGCPKKQRLQKRSKFVSEEESNVIWSICNKNEVAIKELVTPGILYQTVNNNLLN